MKARRFLPIGVLGLLLVVALASLGVGYGLWSQTLFIRGEVTTGTVSAEMSLEWVEENDHGKDVGTCEAFLLDRDETNNTLGIVITNGYPSYECWVGFDVHNTGSIPIHVHLPEVTFTPVAPAPAGGVTMRVENCYPDHVQLHTSERAFCELWFHVEQMDDNQNAEYRIEGTVFVHQFNEHNP
jgi:hypothetical protein